MKKPTNLNMIPAGGWKVTFPTGFTASSNHPADFLKVCFAHMSANKMEEPWVASGDWAAKVWNEVCNQHPEIECDDDQAVPERKFTGADVKRFVASIVHAKMMGAEPVSDAEQDRRLEICRVCPKKTVISCGGICGWLSETLNAFSLGRRARNIPEFHKQHCGACGCDLSLSSGWPLDVLQSVDKNLNLTPDYWDGGDNGKCWKLGG